MTTEGIIPSKVTEAIVSLKATEVILPAKEIETIVPSKATEMIRHGCVIGMGSRSPVDTHVQKEISTFIILFLSWTNVSFILVIDLARKCH
jgi:hypothetical protein